MTLELGPMLSAICCLKEQMRYKPLIVLTLAFVTACLSALLLVFYNPRSTQPNEHLVGGEQSRLIVTNSTGSYQFGISETTEATAFTFSPFGPNFVKITLEEQGLGVEVTPQGTLQLASKESATMFQLVDQPNGKQISVYAPNQSHHDLLLRYKTGDNTDNSLSVGKAEEGYSYYFDVEVI